MLERGLLFIKGNQALLGDGKQFRRFKGQCLAEGDFKVVGLCAHRLVFRQAGVLVGFAVGVGEQPVAVHHQLVLQLQAGQQRGGVIAQVSRVAGQLGQHPLQPLIVGLPGGVGRIQIGDLPGIGRVLLAAFPKVLCHLHDSFVVILSVWSCTAGCAAVDFHGRMCAHSAQCFFSIARFGDNVTTFMKKRDKKRKKNGHSQKLCPLWTGKGS